MLKSSYVHIFIAAVLTMDPCLATGRHQAVARGAVVYVTVHSAVQC
jgi:hypothetical protein